MKQLLTQGIILSRTNYGEADRIITLLTPDQGKLRLMAKGVRKVKSKLAGGIELFSISHITFIQGKGDVGTLVSTRLIQHYGTIVKDITRVQLGYELIKVLDRATEDEPEAEYFSLLQQAFEALDAPDILPELIRIWFYAQLLVLSGHAPNLKTDTSAAALDAAQSYDFSFEDMAFTRSSSGKFDAAAIKFLRLLFSGNPPKVLAKVQGGNTFLEATASLVQAMAQSYIRL